MADVTGPISSLPYLRHTTPEGMICDSCGKPAIVRIQGETDSMGSEMHDLCESCSQNWKKQKESGSCDWCHKEAESLSATRDFEEGMAGPVYYICSDCSRKYQEQILEDYNDMVEEHSCLGPDWDDLYDEEEDSI